MSTLVLLSRLLGFREEILSRMSLPAQRKWLIMNNLLVMTGLALMGMSTGLLVWMLSTRDWAARIWSVAGALAMAGSLIMLHSLLIILGGAPLDRRIAAIETEWRPSRLRLVAFAILSVVLAQPLLLWMQDSRLNAEASERVKFRMTVQSEARERTRLVDTQQELLVTRSTLNDEMQRVQSVASPMKPMTTPTAAVAPRKAMLVGASNYLGRVNSLPNVRNDIIALWRKLESMGYVVTVSMDDPRAEVRRKLEAYGTSLRSGDISLIFFSGHGAENAGHNYFIPRDFAAEPPGLLPPPAAIAGARHSSDSIY